MLSAFAKRSTVLLNKTTTAVLLRTATMAADGLSAAQVQHFNEQGFLIIPDFYSAEDCRDMREACARLVDQYDPAKEGAASVFATKTQRSNDYFLTSGDKVRYFFEEGAIDDDGKVVVPKERAFNKLGHALHVEDPTFKRCTFDTRIQAIAKSLGMRRPIVPQSMYIFKQPGIGGEVVPHQDSTFLYTDPMSATGFWIPLQDCTTTNGCLWMVPGSHKEGLHKGRRMVRVTKDDGTVATEFLGEQQKYSDSDFVPKETKAGSLVLIHGQVVHKSDANASETSRHAYTFHVVESDGVVYDKGNWLQYPEGKAFPPLYQ